MFNTSFGLESCYQEWRIQFFDRGHDPGSRSRLFDWDGTHAAPVLRRQPWITQLRWNRHFSLMENLTYGIWTSRLLSSQRPALTNTYTREQTQHIGLLAASPFLCPAYVAMTDPQPPDESIIMQPSAVHTGRTLFKIPLKATRLSKNIKSVMLVWCAWPD